MHTCDRDPRNCATPAEIVEEWLSDERTRLTQRVQEITGALDRGDSPYHQFTESWDEALESHLEVHGAPFDIEAERQRLTASGEANE